MKTAFIISTGTELLLGDTEDSNSLFLSRRLSEIGIRVVGRSTVGDNESMLEKAFTLGFANADIVISSGGMGPTMDDLTREVACRILGVSLELREDELNVIKDFFNRRRREMPDINRKQAFFPPGAEVFPNNHGSAAGFIVTRESKTLVMLPGPPREMEPMFTNLAEGKLKSLFGKSGLVVSHTLKAMGPGESQVEDMIEEIIRDPKGCAMALLAKEGEVHIRISKDGKNEEEAKETLNQVVDAIREKMGVNIYGEEKDTLAGVLVEALAEEKKTLALAESCTGGLVGKMITDVSGSSSVFWGGIISYDNRAKESVLGVKPETLQRYGAVSEETAKEMAEGVRRLSGADFGVSLTGIAGPGGGSEDKPVGLVYLGLARQDSTKVKEMRFLGGRDAIRTLAARSSLDWLRRVLKEN